MAESVQQAVADIIAEGALDASQAQVLRWLDRRHKRMCARSRCYRASAEFGQTVAGQAFYPLSGVIELYSFEVDGVPWTKARRSDIYGYEQGRVVWCGDGGLAVSDANADGVPGLTLVPTPDRDGLALTGFAALEPPSLTLDGSNGGVFRVDDDMVEALIAGAMATGLQRTGEARPDLAAPLEEQFASACEELRRRVARRFRGPGPTQIRVLGINA